jgi:integrase
LFPHAAGVWAKKIRGKLHYFGPWEDPDGALARYEEQKEALHSGRTPRPDPEAVTVKDVCNSFLNHKAALRDAGELAPRTWDEYCDACDLLVKRFGKARLVDDLRPEDFASLRAHMAERWGPVCLGNAVQKVRSIFKHAFDADLIDRPVRFGPGFARPSKKVLRLHRASQGTKLFTAEEVRQMTDAAGVQLRAMILLGINCGFGNADCGTLPLSALDLERGWLDYPRPKTGIERRCPLWPETVQALREALARRPKPMKEEHAGLAFLTRHGASWFRTTDRNNPVSEATTNLLRKLGINGRNGLGFYTLRHTHRTIADEAKDQPAADFIMGHARDDMASVYRETISDARLRAVTDHVRTWLFGGPDGKAATPAPTA